MEHTHEHAGEHEHPHEHEPKNFPMREGIRILAASNIIGALVIAAGLILAANMLGDKLNGTFVASSSVSAPSAVGAVQAPAPTVAAGPVTIPDRANQPTLGNKNAKVTVVEFGDFQCPFCKQFFQQTFGQIKTQYIDTGKIKYVFRDFPLTQIHVNAQISAEAAECANLQGKFWDYHNLLYTNGQSDGTALDKASLEKYADQLGLNKGTFGFGKNKFNQCLESNSTLSTVNKDEQVGTTAGVNGTPSFFINGVMLVGAQPFSAFQQAIDAALKQ